MRQHWWSKSRMVAPPLYGAVFQKSGLSWILHTCYQLPERRGARSNQGVLTKKGHHQRWSEWYPEEGELGVRPLASTEGHQKIEKGETESHRSIRSFLETTGGKEHSCLYEAIGEAVSRRHRPGHSSPLSPGYRSRRIPRPPEQIIVA